MLQHYWVIPENTVTTSAKLSCFQGFRRRPAESCFRTYFILVFLQVKNLVLMHFGLRESQNETGMKGLRLKSRFFDFCQCQGCQCLTPSKRCQMSSNTASLHHLSLSLLVPSTVSQRHPPHTHTHSHAHTHTKTQSTVLQESKQTNGQISQPVFQPVDHRAHLPYLVVKVYFPLVTLLLRCFKSKNYEKYWHIGKGTK